MIVVQCTQTLLHAYCKTLSIALQNVDHGVPKGGALVPDGLGCLFIRS